MDLASCGVSGWESQTFQRFTSLSHIPFSPGLKVTLSLPPSAPAPVQGHFQELSSCFPGFLQLERSVLWEMFCYSTGVLPSA